MSNESGTPGEYQPGQQGWSGGPAQQPPFPGGGFGQPQQSQGQQGQPGQQPPAGWGFPQQQPGQQPGYGQQQPPSPYGPPPNERGESWFSALFDFEFNKFVTPSVVKILYIVGMVLIGLGWIAFVISAFVGSGAVAGIAVLILGAIVALFYLIFFRVLLEFYYAVVRMSEDIHEWKQRSESR